MTWQAWFTIVLILSSVAILAATQVATDMLFIAALTILLILGILTPAQAFSGFANEGLVTIAALYVIVAGLRETGGMSWATRFILGRPRSLRHAQFKLMVPVTVMSSFMNNTPLVAMLIPVVNDWCRKHHLSVSQLMMPLSYATILGGTCTLIGTSTNLVVNSLLIKQGITLNMFTISPVGIPVAIAGIAFILLAAKYLLPDRRPPIDLNADPREYTAEMLVDMNSPLVGLSIEEAGLRQLQGMYLAEIDRNGVIIPAVTPKEILRGGDRLVFVGIVDSVVELRRMRGLRPAYDQHFKLDTPRHQRCLIEAVASNTCPMLGISIRDGHFRQRYNAVVIAVARNGERIKQKIGDIVLHAGDTLLLEAPLTFVEEHRNSRDFFLVSPIEDSQLIRHERAPLAISILVIMVLLASTGWLSMLQATLVAASMMLLTRCCSLEIARRNIDWTVLVAIGASFGLGSALEVTGAADHIAHYLMSLIGNNPWASLVMIYVLTVCFTELITNNAAAALMFPFASNIAQDLHVNIIPYAIAIMMAASASFATPIGYQTNLMVYGPGGYRFTDYFRLGIPLNILTGIISLLIIFYLWPFK